MRVGLGGGVGEGGIGVCVGGTGVALTGGRLVVGMGVRVRVGGTAVELGLGRVLVGGMDVRVGATDVELGGNSVLVVRIGARVGAADVNVGGEGVWVLGRSVPVGAEKSAAGRIREARNTTMQMAISALPTIPQAIHRRFCCPWRGRTAGPPCPVASVGRLAPAASANSRLTAGFCRMTSV